MGPPLAQLSGSANRNKDQEGPNVPFPHPGDARGVLPRRAHRGPRRLSGDLRHICEDSHVGVDLDLGALPLSAACRAYAASRQFDPVALALTGGEDYELLFTLSPRHRAQVERAAKLHRFRITGIGTIRPARNGIQAIGPDGTRRQLPNTSYEHFR